MSALRNGGPAFPGVTVNDTDGNLTDPFGTLLPPDGQATYSGMTLRDYFAAKVLQGWLGAGNTLVDGEPLREDKHADALAVSCYTLADAMLKARAA